ncbi:MAG: CAP domain-containing protein [Myxococcota bacterium]|jgi:hypothetical protein|nr:CAP domain-containing protein [Myxococcota bacterium]
MRTALLSLIALFVLGLPLGCATDVGPVSDVLDWLNSDWSLAELDWQDPDASLPDTPELEDWPTDSTRPDTDIDIPIDTDTDIAVDTTDTELAEADSSPTSVLCQPCQIDADCGGSNVCLFNRQNGEVFCGIDCRSEACPAGYECAPIDTGIAQCVPLSLTCSSVQVCSPACAASQRCVNGNCVDAGDYEAELLFCVDEINRHRAEHARPALSRSASLEECAASGAYSDSLSGVAHEHFRATGGCGGVAFAENEIPGWPLSMYGSITQVIAQGTQMMMDEGPGGGHYENILADRSAVGCGIYVTPSGEVWVVQNFR